MIVKEYKIRRPLSIETSVFTAVIEGELLRYSISMSPSYCNISLITYNYLPHSEHSRILFNALTYYTIEQN